MQFLLPEFGARDSTVPKSILFFSAGRSDHIYSCDFFSSHDIGQDPIPLANGLRRHFSNIIRIVSVGLPGINGWHDIVFFHFQVT